MVENGQPLELSVLMIGLHQFETEQIPLGGGRSRGLGVVKLETEHIKWIDVNNNPDDPVIYEDGKLLKKTWTASLINHLRENISQNSTEQISS